MVFVTGTLMVPSQKYFHLRLLALLFFGLYMYLFLNGTGSMRQLIVIKRQL